MSSSTAKTKKVNNLNINIHKRQEAKDKLHVNNFDKTAKTKAEKADQDEASQRLAVLAGYDSNPLLSADYWSLNYKEPQLMDCIYNVNAHVNYVQALFEVDAIRIRSVADFGFGTGHLLANLCKKLQPRRVYGCEPSSVVVKEGMDRIELFHCADSSIAWRPPSVSTTTPTEEREEREEGGKSGERAWREEERPGGGHAPGPQSRVIKFEKCRMVLEQKDLMQWCAATTQYPWKKRVKLRSLTDDEETGSDDESCESDGPNTDDFKTKRGEDEEEELVRAVCAMSTDTEQEEKDVEEAEQQQQGPWFDLGCCTSVFQYLTEPQLAFIIPVLAERCRFLYLTVPTDIELGRQAGEVGFCFLFLLCLFLRSLYFWLN